MDSKLLLTNAIPKYSTTCRTHMYADTQADKYIHIREHEFTKTHPPQHSFHSATRLPVPSASVAKAAAGLGPYPARVDNLHCR